MYGPVGSSCVYLWGRSCTVDGPQASGILVSFAAVTRSSKINTYELLVVLVILILSAHTFFLLSANEKIGTFRCDHSLFFFLAYHMTTRNGGLWGRRWGVPEAVHEMIWIRKSSSDLKRFTVPLHD